MTWARLFRNDSSNRKEYDEYIDGFGYPIESHWIGLEHVHRLTKAFNFDLFYEFYDSSKTYKEFSYSQFKLSNQADGYKRSWGTFNDSIYFFLFSSVIKASGALTDLIFASNYIWQTCLSFILREIILPARRNIISHMFFSVFCNETGQVILASNQISWTKTLILPGKHISNFHLFRNPDSFSSNCFQWINFFQYVQWTHSIVQ